jgi:hypothetical protein
MAHLIIPIPSQAATANVTSDTQTLAENNSYQNASFQYVATDFDAADATVKLQSSNVPSPGSTDWVDVVDSTKTIASGDSTDYFILSNISMKHYRVVFTKNTNAAGTIAVYINFN